MLLNVLVIHKWFIMYFIHVKIWPCFLEFVWYPVWLCSACILLYIDKHMIKNTVNSKAHNKVKKRWSNRDYKYLKLQWLTWFQYKFNYRFKKILEKAWIRTQREYNHHFKKFNLKIQVRNQREYSIEFFLPNQNMDLQISKVSLLQLANHFK